MFVMYQAFALLYEESYETLYVFIAPYCLKNYNVLMAASCLTSLILFALYSLFLFIALVSYSLYDSYGIGFAFTCYIIYLF